MGAILRARDKDGNVYDIPAIRGAQGPEGPQGPKGDTGNGLNVLDYYDTLEALEAAVTAGEVDVVAGKIFVDASGAEKTGTLVVQAYYYGSSAPSADLGADGDLYLKL